jgi:hypothetical protein
MARPRKGFWDTLLETLKDLPSTGLEMGGADPFQARLGTNAGASTPEQQAAVTDYAGKAARGNVSTLLGALTGGSGALANPLNIIGGGLNSNVAETGVQGGIGMGAEKLSQAFGNAHPALRTALGIGGAVGQYLGGHTAGNIERAATGEQQRDVRIATGVVPAAAMGAVPAIATGVLKSSKSFKAQKAFEEFENSVGGTLMKKDAAHGSVMQVRTPSAGEAQDVVSARLTPPKTQPDDVLPELRLKREKALEKRTALEAEIGADEVARLRQGKERSLKEVRDFAKQQETVGTSNRTTQLQNELTDLHSQLRKAERPSDKDAIRNRIDETRKRLQIVKTRKEPLDTSVNEDNILRLRERETDLMRQRDQARLAQADKDVDLLDLEITKSGMKTPEWSSGLTVKEAERLQPLADAPTSQEFFDLAYRNAMRATGTVPDQANKETINTLYKVWNEAGSTEAPKVFQANFLTDFLKHSYDDTTGTFTKAGEVYRRVGHEAVEAAFGGDAEKADSFVRFVEALNKAMPSKTSKAIQTAAIFGVPDIVIFHMYKPVVGTAAAAAGVAATEVLKRTRWRDLMDTVVRDPKAGRELLEFLESGEPTAKALARNRALNNMLAALPGVVKTINNPGGGGERSNTGSEAMQKKFEKIWAEETPAQAPKQIPNWDKAFGR